MIGLTLVQDRLKVRTATPPRQSNGANLNGKSNREFRDAGHLFLALVTYVVVKAVMRITEPGFEKCHLICVLYDSKCHSLHPAGGVPGEMPIFGQRKNHSDVFIHTDSPLLLLNAMPE